MLLISIAIWEINNDDRKGRESVGYSISEYVLY